MWFWWGFKTQKLPLDGTLKSVIYFIWNTNEYHSTGPVKDNYSLGYIIEVKTGCINSSIKYIVNPYVSYLPLFMGKWVILTTTTHNKVIPCASLLQYNVMTNIKPLWFLIYVYIKMDFDYTGECLADLSLCVLQSLPCYMQYLSYWTIWMRPDSK